MADWYVSSTAYAAIPAFQINTAYTVGQIIKPIAPTASNKWAFRCTTAGTTAATEPGWGLNNNQATTSGTATFTCVGGQSTYFWAAAAGDLGSITNEGTGGRVNAGDRIFVSSDHIDSSGGKTYFYWTGGAWDGRAPTQFLSVNRFGSTPPVAADLVPGATIITTAGGSINMEAPSPIYYYGFAIQVEGGINFNNNHTKFHYLKDCSIWLNNTAANRINNGTWSRVTFDNTTVRFGGSGQSIGAATYAFDFLWINTPSAIQGIVIPNNLFTGSGYSDWQGICRGVDFSAVTTGLVNTGSPGVKMLFDGCKIAPSVARFPGTPGAAGDIVELVGCFDGTNTINERYVAAGAVTTERTTVMVGGAIDDTGTFSHKMVSTSLIDRWVVPLEGFWLEVGNAIMGVSKTATVEIISSGTLNNDDISLLLEYQGTAGSTFVSFANNLPATILTTPTAVTASTATWVAPPATPVKQKLQVTFTPQMTGRVRGQVRLGKLSTLVYVNPVITIT